MNREVPEIEAMPSLTDSTDFGLTNDGLNRKLLDSLLKKKPKVLEDRGDSVLYVTGNEKGYYFLVEDQRIAYLSKYQKSNKKMVGHSTVTQVAVWLALDAPLSAGGTVTNTIFKHMLPRFGAIMSDRIQTLDGRRLWIRLLALGLKYNYHVALADFHGRRVLEIGSMAELRLWDQIKDGIWSWNSNKHQGLRFLISKKPFPSTVPMLNDVLESLT